MNVVLQDLIRAAHDDDMFDITLIGRDGLEIPASRFVLAARSRIFKRMFYGSFREAKSDKVVLEYDGVILEAIVEFCSKNEIPKFRVFLHRHEASTRRLVQLFKAADYLELNELATLVAQTAHNLTSRFPSLACAVFDEADGSTRLAKDALMMIQCRPYVTLPPDGETQGGIDCLSPLKIEQVFVDKDVKASELFLFEMLRKWMEHHERPEDFEIAQRCAAHLRLEDIEPHDLLTIIKPSGLCSDMSITEAVTTQALRASQNHIWTLSSRGRPNIERVIVEGAGSVNVNGIYYHIDGLANGSLYSKREVACGQQHVYTLSISPSNNGMTECRIFCSPLLSQKSIQKIVKKRSNSNEASFQPLLQILRIGKLSDDSAIASIANRPSTTNTAPIVGKYTQVKVSDGDHFLFARIRTSAIRNHIIRKSTLIKILEFSTYAHEGKIAIHLKKISIVSQDPGHTFGSPVYYHDVFDDDISEDGSQEIINESDDPIEIEISQGLLQANPSFSKEIESNSTLQQIYSCSFHAKETPLHSKIPNIGWKIDQHGQEPVPKTRWIPGTTHKDPSPVGR